MFRGYDWTNWERNQLQIMAHNGGQLTPELRLQLAEDAARETLDRIRQDQELDYAA